MSALKTLIQRFKRLERLDVERSLEPIHAVLLQRARDAFRTSGRSEGQAWADYSSEPKYKSYKAALGADPRPLRWVPGSMERLMPSLTNPRDPSHLWSLSGGKASFGSSLPYLARIESGGVNQFGERFPGRRILPASPGLRREVAQAVRKDLYARIGRETGLKVEKR